MNFNLVNYLYLFKVIIIKSKQPSCSVIDITWNAQ